MREEFGDSGDPFIKAPHWWHEVIRKMPGEIIGTMFVTRHFAFQIQHIFENPLNTTIFFISNEFGDAHLELKPGLFCVIGVPKFVFSTNSTGICRESGVEIINIFNQFRQNIDSEIAVNIPRDQFAAMVDRDGNNLKYPETQPVIDASASMQMQICGTYANSYPILELGPVLVKDLETPKPGIKYVCCDPKKELPQREVPFHG